MKITEKIALTTILLTAMLIADIPLLPVELVSEAQAIFGVRRRTAVVAYSAGRASASAAASQQQAAAAQQQAPAPQQQAPPPPPQPAAPSQSVSAVPVGTIAPTLPGKCIPVTVGNVKYQDCGGSFYRVAFQGNNLVYVVVDKPL